MRPVAFYTCSVCVYVPTVKMMVGMLKGKKAPGKD